MEQDKMFTKIMVALLPYQIDEVVSVDVIAGPGNWLVQYNTQGDFRIALLDNQYRVLWENSLAASFDDRLRTGADGAPFPGGTMPDHDYVIFDPALPAPRKGPIALAETAGMITGLPPQEATERAAVPEAIRLGQEAIDVIEAALRGEEGLCITLKAFRALVEPHGYDAKPGVHGNNLYIWRGNQYIQVISMMRGEEIDAEIAGEFLEGEKIVLLPKKSV